VFGVGEGELGILEATGRLPRCHDDYERQQELFHFHVHVDLQRDYEYQKNPFFSCDSFRHSTLFVRTINKTAKQANRAFAIMMETINYLGDEDEGLVATVEQIAAQRSSTSASQLDATTSSSSALLRQNPVRAKKAYASLDMLEILHSVQ
jgi:hypothetical protein